MRPLYSREVKYEPTLDGSCRGNRGLQERSSGQLSFQVPSVGPGSVFFEKIFAGLDGAADKFPQDGVVTFDELAAYLRSEIPLATNGIQVPVVGDISRNGSEGEFFFLNRGREVRLRNSRP